MKFLTKEEMTKVDELMIENGVTVARMMEIAGFQIANFIQKFNPKKILVVCGPGNNGGDGLCAARYLCTRGYDVSVYLTPKRLHSHSQEQFEILKKMGVKFISDVGSFKQYNIIVDAIFGYNLKGTPEISLASAGFTIKDVIDGINKSNSKIISIDVPSGFEVGKGKTEICIEPDIVLALSFPKKGLENYKTYVVDIGILPSVYKELGLKPIDFGKERIIKI